MGKGGILVYFTSLVTYVLWSYNISISVLKQ